MPVHKRPTADCEPAIIHRIETTSVPLQQIRTVPKFSHIFIAVKLAKENTVPNTKQWATWLKTNLPNYIGEIDITAKWNTERNANTRIRCYASSCLYRTSSIIQ